MEKSVRGGAGHKGKNKQKNKKGAEKPPSATTANEAKGDADGNQGKSQISETPGDTNTEVKINNGKPEECDTNGKTPEAARNESKSEAIASHQRKPQAGNKKKPTAKDLNKEEHEAVEIQPTKAHPVLMNNYWTLEGAPDDNALLEAAKNQGKPVKLPRNKDETEAIDNTTEPQETHNKSKGDGATEETLPEVATSKAKPDVANNKGRSMNGTTGELETNGDVLEVLVEKKLNIVKGGLQKQGNPSTAPHKNSKTEVNGVHKPTETLEATVGRNSNGDCATMTMPSSKNSRKNAKKAQKKKDHCPPPETASKAHENASCNNSSDIQMRSPPVLVLKSNENGVGNSGNVPQIMVHLSQRDVKVGDETITTFTSTVTSSKNVTIGEPTVVMGESATTAATPDPEDSSPSIREAVVNALTVVEPSDPLPPGSKVPIVYKQYESELQMHDIMRLIQAELSEPYSIYTYRYFIYNWPKLCFLAAHGDEYVGAIVCKLDMYMNVKRGYIAMLAVRKEYRKLKIGTNLVQRAIEEMVADNADEVVLETEMQNVGALRLYENLGFVRDKRLFRYYLNGVDALRLKLWFR